MPDRLPPLHRVIAALVGLVLLVALGSRARSPDPDTVRIGSVIRSARPVMGTLLEISIWAPTGSEPAAADAALQALLEVTALEKRISSWDSQSKTSEINLAAGAEAVAVGPALEELVSDSLDWARRTEGAFDFTGGPLFELWEQAREKEALPAESEIRARLQLVGYEKVQLRNGTIRLTVPGMKIGFGAVGKGFAADRVAQSLRSSGFPDFIIDVGGDLVIGGKRGDTPWNIAIRHPRRGSHLATIATTDCAITTSGDYERYFTVDDVRYSHIIDPRSGWPARGLTSVTVIAPRGIDADALTTAISVMGVDAGLNLVESIPDVEALMVEEDGSMHLSTGLQMAKGFLTRLQ